MSASRGGTASREPLKDMPDEAKRVVDYAQSKGVQLRIMGGIAVRMHCTSLEFCERPYSDIDLMRLGAQAAIIEKAFVDLGYVPDKPFNVLHGYQRLKFEDHVNNRHVEVFLDKFRMDHTMDFQDRLAIYPYTLSLTDLFMTKIQVVKMDEKDFHDLFSLQGPQDRHRRQRGRHKRPSRRPPMRPGLGIGSHGPEEPGTAAGLLWPLQDRHTGNAVDGQKDMDPAAQNNRRAQGSLVAGQGSDRRTTSVLRRGRAREWRGIDTVSPSIRWDQLFLTIARLSSATDFA
ncbi:MAG TPA: hypothetical protein VF374_08345 [Thermoplasmata archaeon]|jgi:hypothetical protein